jgi:phosphohistidine swiveling domain-containing protein
MTQAIIIEGTRARRLDASQSKPGSLESVAQSGRPVLDWILEALKQAGISDPLYVGDYHIEKIIAQFPGLDVRYRKNAGGSGELSALLACEPPKDELVIVRAGTILLPAALAGMPAAPFARAVYGRGEDAGIYVIAKDHAETFFRAVRALEEAEPSADLTKLFDTLPGVVTFPVDGSAAPISDPEGVARTVFGGKAQALDNLAPLVRGATFLPRVRLTVAEWRQSRGAVLAQVTTAFAGKTLIVRSSARSEDGLFESGAGKYLSVLDVDAAESGALPRAIDAVIASYGLPSPDDEVLIQPQLKDLSASGVLLTRDPRSGAPYYVINQDRTSGRSDTVTGGHGEQIEHMFIAWSGTDSSTLNPETRKLLALGRELMDISHLDALDIEYAVTNDGRLHLLQVRPLAAARKSSAIADDDVLDLLAGIRSFVQERMNRQSGLAGGRTILGIMPDWNPAEMIGAAPRPLALSLYQKLIGHSAWAEARAGIGYRDVRPEPLILSLGGRPFVDVRASLNSFLPAALDETDAERWIDACLERLRCDPALHDKIEFDVAVTCLAPDWDGASKRVAEAGLDPVRFAGPLRALTAGILLETDAPISVLEDQLQRLAERRHRHLAAAGDGAHDLARTILHLLEDCRTFGVVPFSILARYAFIAMNFLHGMRKTDVIREDDYHAFFRSLPSVAGTIADDMSGDIKLAELVDRYGHLRPNSYEITSPNYASNPAQFFGTSTTRTAGLAAEPVDGLMAARSGAIEKMLRGLGLDLSAAQLMRFIGRAIAGRERAKFEFTKNLDAALEKIASLGARIGMDREQMSLLNIGDIIGLATNSAAPSDYAQLRRQSAYNEKRWITGRALQLPDVICDSADVLAFRQEARRPNFVTRKRVVARAVWLDDARPQSDLEGAVVITRAADPGYDWLFARNIAGLVTEYGGVASHMAIRAAEFGLPAAIGCGAMILEQLKGAASVELDCLAERIRPGA